MVISDSLDGIKSMVSGERFDSKANLRRHYRANNVIEVGNDPVAREMKGPARPRIKRDDVRQAIAKVRNGYRPSLPAN